MGVESPLPRSLSLLLLALPWIFLAGRDVARWLTFRRSLRRALAPGIGLSLWLLSVHVVGLATRSFVYGLSLGTLGVALSALGYRALRWGDPARTARPPREGPGLGAALLIAIMTIPVAEMAFGYAFHDEYMYTGHMSVSAEIQNNVYPPRHLAFPDVPLRYHYGVDLLTASLAAILRVRVDIALDIATVLLWPYTAWLLWVLGDLWLGRGRGFLAAMMTLFAGGVPACFNIKGYKFQEIISVCDVKGLWTLPPIISMFFQHPWSLGLPFALAALLVFSAPEAERRAPRLAVLSLLFAALSIGHVVLFLTLLPSIVAAELFRLWVKERRPLREGLGIVVSGAVGVAAAVVLGGFFTSHGAGGLASSVIIKPGVVDGLSNALLWHAQSYGLALPLALVGLWLLPPRGRFLMALLLAGSLVVLNTFHYLYSWDMVKFGTVTAIVTGLAGAAVASRLLRARKGRGFVRRAGRAGLGALLVLSTTSSGLAFVFAFMVPRKDLTTYFSKRCCAKLSRDDTRAAAFIRKRLKPGEIVFRREGPAAGYAQWGGLPVPWLDWAVYAFGFPAARTEPRVRLLQELPGEPERYLAQGIDWFVLEPADTRLNTHADGWILNGRAVELATYGKLRVVKLMAEGAPR